MDPTQGHRILAERRTNAADYKFLLVGRTVAMPEGYYQKMAPKNVIFHPWVHRTFLYAFYSAGDIAVWPGSSSISIVEAASVGLPVIIERSPVEIYAIEYGNGFAFKRGDINELRKYLEILIHDGKLREEMGLKSRLLVEHKLNWRAITLQYLDAYTHLQ